MKRKKILIVGGGISGLTTAALLEKQGIRPVIVERDKNWERTGFGITIMPPGFRILKELGLDEEIRTLGTTPRYAEFRAPDGHILNKIAMGKACIGFITLPREALQKKLLALLETTTFFMGTTVKQITEGSDGVTVCLSDNSKHTFDLVIGADGVNSKIRQLMFPGYKPTYTGSAIWTFYMPHNVPPPDPFATSFISGNKRLLGIFPFNSTAAVSYCALIGPSTNLKNIDLAADAKELTFMGKDILSKVDSKAVFSRHLRQVKLQSWHAGRVVLIGDAAHAMMPSTAMAVAMGMSDAMTLVREIVKYEPAQLPLAAAAYEKERRRRVTYVQKEADIVWKLLVLNKLPVWLKNALIRVLPLRLLTIELRRS